MEHYLDNAATTAVLPCAREAAIAAMDNFGNPGSLHARGTAARKVLDDSRKKVAAALSVKPACVTFTSALLPESVFTERIAWRTTLSGFASKMMLALSGVWEAFPDAVITFAQLLSERSSQSSLDDTET